jgi:hypothetical protein
MKLRALAVAAMTVSAGAIALLARWTPWPAPLAAGMLLAWVLAVPSFLSLSFTLHKSDTAFMAAFGGGVLVRLAALMIAVLAVHRKGFWPAAPFAVAAAGGLTALTMIELIFLQRQNRTWTSSKP